MHWQDGDWIMDYEGWFSSLAWDLNGTAWLCSEGSVYRLEGEHLEKVAEIPGSQCQIAADSRGRVWATNYFNLWWIYIP